MMEWIVPVVLLAGVAYLLWFKKDKKKGKK